MSEPFIAEIKIFAGNFAPRSYAFCDGTLLPIAQNTALFSLIGTTYGGDGRTTTALPNLLDRAPMHPGRGPGLTARSLGQRGGSAEVTMTTANLPNHNHAVSTGDPASAGTNSPENASPGAAPIYRIDAPVANMSNDAIESAGSDTPDPMEDRQPFLEMNFIIALQGLFPSRS
jgi:microcystin-dependent protein